MPQSCPLTSACASKYMHTQKHTQRNNILNVDVNIWLNKSQDRGSQGLYHKGMLFTRATVEFASNIGSSNVPLTRLPNGYHPRL